MGEANTRHSPHPLDLEGLEFDKLGRSYRREIVSDCPGATVPERLSLSDCLGPRLILILVSCHYSLKLRAAAVLPRRRKQPDTRRCPREDNSLIAPTGNIADPSPMERIIVCIV